MEKILWPLVKNVIRRNKISNTYGHFPERKSGVHYGWDFYAPAGTACYAISDGKIVEKYGNAHDTGNFGLVAVLEFKFQGEILYAAYCHLGAILAKMGPIKAGECIGYTGNSGNAYNMTGEEQHLHFELRTSVRPPPGGAPYRLSPLKIFQKCPLHHVIVEH